MKPINYLVTSIVIFFILAASCSNSLISQKRALNDLWCMEFIDDQIGITIGENGVIMQTINGGLEWEQKESGTFNTLKKTAILTDDDIVVVGLGGVILKTTNQGSNWSPMLSGISNDLYGVSFGGRDNEVGIAVGSNGLMIRSTDQGETWYNLNVNDSPEKNVIYRAVSFASESNGIIVGDRGIILVTNDGGLTWHSGNTALPPVNYKFVIMLTEDLAYATGENGIIVKTTDGGESWESKSPGIGSSLYRIRFADDQIAISVGTDGTILKTTNGGNSWNTETSGTVNDLNCLFVVDENISYTGGEDGVIFKTTDGGANWFAQGTRVLNDVELSHSSFYSYPNPSNPVSTISYYVPEDSYVSISVYDVTGKFVSSLVNGTKQSGLHYSLFNGLHLSSGTYFCRIAMTNKSGTAAKTIKIILVK